MIIFGAWMLIDPHETVVHHPVISRHGSRLGDPVEHVSQTGARIYGGFAVLFGIGLAAICLRRDECQSLRAK